MLVTKIQLESIAQVMFRGGFWYVPNPDGKIEVSGVVFEDTSFPESDIEVELAYLCGGKEVRKALYASYYGDSRWDLRFGHEETEVDHESFEEVFEYLPSLETERFLIEFNDNVLND